MMAASGGAMTSSLLQCDPLPTDAISRVRFSPNDKHLVTTSWDGSLSIFETTTGLRVQHVDLGSSLLDGCILKDNKTVVCGGLGQNVLIVEPEAGGQSVVASHTSAIRSMAYHRDTNLLFSGSWDGSVIAYDVRQRAVVTTLHVSGKVFCMDVSEKGRKLVVGASTKGVTIFDLRSLDTAEEVRDPLMKYQLRTVACFPDGRGFAAGSVEGRVTWEYFQGKEPAGAKPYAFKCHREKFEGGGETVWPVNVIAFNPVHHTFATGGSDGSLSVWDGFYRKRLWKYSKVLPTSITSCAFSANGKIMAVAASYDFAQGAQPPARPQYNASEDEVLDSVQLLIRHMKDEEVHPKGDPPK